MKLKIGGECSLAHDAVMLRTELQATIEESLIAEYVRRGVAADIGIPQERVTLAGFDLTEVGAADRPRLPHRADVALSLAEAKPDGDAPGAPVTLKLRVYKSSGGYPLRVVQIIDGAEREVRGIERISMMAVYGKVRINVRAIAEVETVTVGAPKRD